MHCWSSFVYFFGSFALQLTLKSIELFVGKEEEEEEERRAETKNEGQTHTILCVKGQGKGGKASDRLAWNDMS